MAVGWHHPTVEIDQNESDENGEGIKSEPSIAQRSTVESGGGKSKRGNQGDEFWAVDL